MRCFPLTILYTIYGAMESKAISANVEETILEKTLTLEGLENYLVASVYIKIVCLLQGGGLGWDLWEDENLF